MRRVVAILLGALALAWLASLAAVVWASRHDAARPADAIVVLGAAQYNGHPSPVLKARLDHAARLFRRHFAPRVIVTGGVGTGDSVSEAVVARRYLLEAGIPDSVVRADTAGRTSDASLRAVRADLPAGGRTVILVSDGFHMFRLGIIARRVGLSPLGSPAPRSPIRASRRTEALYLLAESFKAPAAFLVTRWE
ncbi:MAG: YdcF family protein [Gemmatimonadales bacterium]